MLNIRKNEIQSRYELVQDGQVVGFAEYLVHGDSVILPHTVVDDSHEGEGLGGQLAKFALEDVKAEGKAVLPACPFIAAYIRHHPEYRALVPQDQWARFGL
ncbi:GNAT family N-acetyltransferase [Deinococcus sp.]|uniref:GNAT family N-acetyltransferase n=1 Tax=Deinococcus sp. TaxID=47478 RepID=UPI0025C029AA|nr:GNAT family N-acetyltransferase [Deinococcus sp.]